MRISNGQKRQIEDGIAELKKLSTLENAAFDNETKKKIKMWASWIDVYATKIEEGLNNNLWDGYYYNE